MMAKSTPIAPPTLRVVASKPKMTIYFALLIIALIAMLFACLFLFLEIRRFGGFGAVPGRVSANEAPNGAPLLAAADSSVATEYSTVCLAQLTSV